MLRPDYAALLFVLLLTVPACEEAAIPPNGANGGAVNTAGSGGLGPTGETGGCSPNKITLDSYCSADCRTLADETCKLTIGNIGRGPFLQRGCALIKYEEWDDLRGHSVRIYQQDSGQLVWYLYNLGYCSSMNFEVGEMPSCAAWLETTTCASPSGSTGGAGGAGGSGR